MKEREEAAGSWHSHKLAKLPPVISYKWCGGKLLDEGFVALPLKLLRCLPQIFNGDNAIDQLRVVLAVVDMKNPRLVELPSLCDIAQKSGISEDQAALVLQELEAKKLVYIEGDKKRLDVEIAPLVKKAQLLLSKQEGGAS